jgi:DNA-binding FadR family transcriptional regulator
VRSILEPAAAELAAREATAEEVQAVYALYKKMEQEMDNFESYTNADMQFHRTIFKSIHNDVLIQIHENIYVVLQATQRVFRAHRDTVLEAVKVHREVAEAILRRDAKGAALAMTRLVQQAQRDLCWVLHITSAERSRESGLTLPSPRSTPEEPRVGENAEEVLTEE